MNAHVTTDQRGLLCRAGWAAAVAVAAAICRRPALQRLCRLSGDRLTLVAAYRRGLISAVEFLHDVRTGHPGWPGWSGER